MPSLPRCSKRDAPRHGGPPSWPPERRRDWTGSSSAPTPRPASSGNSTRKVDRSSGRWSSPDSRPRSSWPAGDGGDRLRCVRGQGGQELRRHRVPLRLPEGQALGRRDRGGPRARPSSTSPSPSASCWRSPPITNPTSTVLFKAIVAAKTRNAIVFRPSARAVRCAERAVEILQRGGRARRPAAATRSRSSPTRRSTSRSTCSTIPASTSSGRPAAPRPSPPPTRRASPPQRRAR